MPENFVRYNINNFFPTHQLFFYHGQILNFTGFSGPGEKNNQFIGINSFSGATIFPEWHKFGYIGGLDLRGLYGQVF